MGADVTEIEPGVPEPEIELPVGSETMTLTIWIGIFEVDGLDETWNVATAMLPAPSLESMPQIMQVVPDTIRICLRL